jgi:hypothetical protein
VPRRRSLISVGLAGLIGFVLLSVPGGGVQDVIGVILLGGMLIAAIAVLVARLGPQSQPEREREALAREEFDRTGEWPPE